MESSGLDSVNQPAEAELATVFVFSIGGIQFALNTDVFCEVVVDMQTAFIPNAPICFYGIGHLRGGVVPIYQLYSSINKEIPRKKVMFFMGKGEQVIGLLIDQLPKALQLSNQKSRGATEPVEWFEKAFSGSWSEIEGKPVYLLKSAGWLNALYSYVDQQSGIRVA